MNTTMTDKTWIDLFTVELRARRVPGAVIGDAVATVREHLADSGQSAEDAFGAPREYAASLSLPTMNPRQKALKTLFLPVMGMFAFMIFTLASSAWFAGDPVRLSVVGALVLAVPVAIVVLFSFPLWQRAAVVQRWLPSLAMLVALLAGAIAALSAPRSDAEAWLVFSPLLVMIIAMAVLVTLAVVGTITTLRSNDAENIIDPLDADAASGSGRKVGLLVVDWLFVILAALAFVMTWVLSLTSP